MMRFSAERIAMRGFFRRYRGWMTLALALAALLVPFIVLSANPGETVGTAWVFLPLALTLVLVLLTREVYSALFAGIVCAALLCADYSFTGGMEALLGALEESVGSRTGLCMILLLFLFGSLIQLVQRSGGTAAFTRAVVRRVRTPKRALLCCALLGGLFFYDDYLSILATGAAAKPVAEEYRISRARLSWILDTTAAPVCVLIPVTTFGAVISLRTGLPLYAMALPFCFYAMFSLLLLAFCLWLDIDIGPMRRMGRTRTELPEEELYGKGDTAEADIPIAKKHSTVWDMLVPLLALAVCCTVGLVYTGGVGQNRLLVRKGEQVIPAAGCILYAADGTEVQCDGEGVFTLAENVDGTKALAATAGQVTAPEGVSFLLTEEWLLSSEDGNLYTAPRDALLAFVPGAVYEVSAISVITAMTRSDSAPGLALGALAALLLSMAFYVVRGVLSFRECMAALPRGFRNMVPTVLLLALSQVFSRLLTTARFGPYLGGVIGQAGGTAFLPLLLFLAGVLFSFAVGSSFSTYLLLLPVAVAVGGEAGMMQALCVAAVLSGGLFGDHTSLLSNTTLLSAAAAECDVLEHVLTQLPYALIAAVCSAVGYLVGGLAESAMTGFAVAFGCFAFALLLLLLRQRFFKPHD